MMMLAGVFERFDLDCIELVTYGTEPMRNKMQTRIRDKLPRAKFAQTFGTSET